MKTKGILISLAMFATTDISAGGTLYVFAEKGSVLRSEPSTAARTLALLPFGQPVTVLRTAPRRSRVEEYSGHWTRVRVHKTQGWLFGAFLSPYPPPKACVSFLDLMTHHLGPPTRIEKREPRPPAVTTIRHFKGGSFISLSGGYDFSEEVVHLKNVPVWPAFLLAKQCELGQKEARFKFEYGPDRIVGRSDLHETVEITGGPSGSTIKFSTSS